MEPVHGNRLHNRDDESRPELTVPGGRDGVAAVSASFRLRRAALRKHAEPPKRMDVALAVDCRQCDPVASNTLGLIGCRFNQWCGGASLLRCL
jgi:hypothetical protein